MKLFLFLIPALIMVTSCGSTQQKPNEKTIEYELLNALDGRSLDQKQPEIIRDQQTLSRLYAQFNKKLTPPLTLPEINFNKNSVLSVPYQIKDHSKNEVKLQRIKMEGQTLILYVKEKLMPQQPVNKYFWEKLFIVKVTTLPKEVRIKTLHETK